MVYQGSLNGTHFGKIKVEAKIYASFEGFPDFPYNGALALFGLVKKMTPGYGREFLWERQKHINRQPGSSTVHVTFLDDELSETVSLLERLANMTNPTFGDQVRSLCLNHLEVFGVW